MSKVFKKRIMRRVYAIWALRQIFSPFSMKLLILLGIVKQSANLIFVRSVLSNAPSPLDPMANFQFFSGAFFHTNLTIKLLLISTIALSFWLLRDIILRPRLQLAYR
jgi:hypothetical protein